MFRKVGPVVAAILFVFSCAALGQESRSEVSASFTGNFSKESDGQGVTQTPTQSGGFVASYRYSFASQQAVELNYGYTRNSQNYSLSGLGGFPSFFGIQTNVHEATAAYVFTPRSSGKLSPFLLGGGGALVFAPTGNFNNTSLGAGTEAKGTFLYGGGLDCKLFGGVAVRLQYRGLIYKAPDFNLPGFSTGGWGHMAEPTAGLVFRF